VDHGAVDDVGEASLEAAHGFFVGLAGGSFALVVVPAGGRWAAMCAISGRLGMTAETLRKWVRQAEVDEGQSPGVPTGTAREIRELKRKNAELERTIEILKAATTFFARECDPQHW
jgi:transposase